MSTRYRLGDHWHTAASLATLLEEDPTRTREVARALRTPRTIEPGCAIDALEDVIDRLHREDTTDVTRRAGLGGRHEPNRDKESTMTAHRFRKRPVEVEAHRFGPDAPTATDTHTWAEGLVGYYDCTKPGPAPTSGVSIDPADGLTVIATLEGALKVQPGDWIVRGVRGELYPVRNDIFEATYEPVED